MRSSKRPLLVAETSFTCPTCKGTHYTSLPNFDDELVRYCQGRLASGEQCRVSWRATEDARFLAPTGRMVPVQGAGAIIVKANPWKL